MLIELVILDFPHRGLAAPVVGHPLSSNGWCDVEAWRKIMIRVRDEVIQRNDEQSETSLLMSCRDQGLAYFVK